MNYATDALVLSPALVQEDASIAAKKQIRARRIKAVIEYAIPEST